MGRRILWRSIGVAVGTAVLVAIASLFQPLFWVSAQLSAPGPTPGQETLQQDAIHQHGLVAVDPERPIPSLALELIPDAMEGYNLHLLTKHYRFTPEKTNQDNANGQGHAHLYINGKKIKRLYGAWEHLSSKLFQAGENLIAVTLNANDHAVWRVNRSEVMAQILVDTKAVGAGAIASQNLAYQLDWQWGQARPQANRQSWSVTNNLGYHVTVNRGYLTTHNLELIACDPTTAALPSHLVSSVLDLWLHPFQLLAALLPKQQIFSALKAQPAFAGHGNVTYNPSRITMPYVESLAQPIAAQLETHSVPKASYCQVHYLIARAAGAVQNQPEDRRMDGLSLWVEGEYVAPDAITAKPFIIKSSLAWGTITTAIASEETSNPAPRIALSSGQPIARVTLHRNLGSMFDGVDFETMSESEQAKTILRSLARSVEMRVADAR